MAVILVDSCVITDLANPESPWYQWSAETLEKLDHNNVLAINPIIYAECSIGYASIEEVESVFEHLGFAMKDIPKEALFLAGKAFLQYKQRKGEKGNVLPDFFIGAQAAVSNYGLITRDRGRFSTYFPSVRLIMPDLKTDTR